jgi:hypothetical protein
MENEEIKMLEINNKLSVSFSEMSLLLSGALHRKFLHPTHSLEICHEIPLD